MNTETKQKMEAIESQCLDVLKDAFTEGITNDVVKQAKDTLAIIAKNRQTMNAREAVRFHMVESFATPEEKENYVIATCREIRKAMPAKGE